MKRILITGSTGNVGIELTKNLENLNALHHIILGNYRKNEKQKNLQSTFETTYFDFGDINSIDGAFKKCDILFLLRPPQIADVPKYFKPLIDSALEHNVEHIVFLSVQGAESSSFIPHNKIERLIIDSGIDYTFLRPAYFMQNFTTTLRNDIVEHKKIFLPAGKSKFTLIDVSDIGLVGAKVLLNVEKYKNIAIELTNDEQLNFYEMTQIINEEIGDEIEYVNPNLFHFFLSKSKEKVSANYIFVLIMLHYLPRFRSVPTTTDWVEKICSLKPKTFREFIKKNHHLLTK